jgi:hypothetical protein
VDATSDRSDPLATKGRHSFDPTTHHADQVLAPQVQPDEELSMASRQTTEFHRCAVAIAIANFQGAVSLLDSADPHRS